MINLEEWVEINEAIQNIVDKYVDYMQESCGLSVQPLTDCIQYNHEIECIVVPTWEWIDGCDTIPSWISIDAEQIESEIYGDEGDKA